MSDSMVINSTESLQSAFGRLRNAFMSYKYLQVSVRKGKDRSLKQNSHSHAWYGQLERELPEDDASGWKCFCKLHFGVPILRAEDPDFREMYDAKLRPLPYETKLLLMRWIPVTSLMTKAQLKNYETAMQEHFARHGVTLDYPDSDVARIEKARAA